MNILHYFSMNDYFYRMGPSRADAQLVNDLREFLLTLKTEQLHRFTPDFYAYWHLHMDRPDLAQRVASLFITPIDIEWVKFHCLLPGKDLQPHIDSGRLSAINFKITDTKAVTTYYHPETREVVGTYDYLNNDMYMLDVSKPHSVKNDDSPMPRWTCSIAFQMPYEQLLALHLNGKLFST